MRPRDRDAALIAMAAAKQGNESSSSTAADHNHYQGSNRETRTDLRSDGQGQGLGLGLGSKGDVGYDYLFVSFVENLLGTGLRVLRRLLFVLRLLGTHRRLRLGEKLPLGYARIPLKEAHKAAVCELWKEMEHMVLEQLLIHLREKEVEAISDVKGSGLGAAKGPGLAPGISSAKNSINSGSTGGGGGYSHQPSGEDRQRVVFGDLSGDPPP